MDTTNTIAIATHRHELADDALGEILEVVRALQIRIAQPDVSFSVAKLARGMLSRIEALSSIASELLSEDENDRRLDEEIRRELTGLPAGVLPAASRGGDLAAAAQPAASLPATGDAIEVTHNAMAGLRAWCLLLPADTDHINAGASSAPQLVLRAIIEHLESVFDGPGDDIPARQAAALLQSVEAVLWKVSTFELESLSVDWCSRVAGVAAAILEAAVLRAGRA